VLEVMFPQLYAQFSRAIQRRTYRQIREQRRLQPGIEQCKSGGEATGLGLQTTDQHAIQIQAFQIIVRVRRRRITVFDENTIRLDQAVIVRRRVPAELSLERRAVFVVTFDGGDAGQRANERPDGLIGSMITVGFGNECDRYWNVINKSRAPA
jgi:hypothetical protein